MFDERQQPLLQRTRVVDPERGEVMKMEICSPALRHACHPKLNLGTVLDVKAFFVLCGLVASVAVAAAVADCTRQLSSWSPIDTG